MIHETTVEHVPVAQSEARCSCGWRGNPKMFLEWAEKDAAEHEAKPDAPPRQDPLRALLDPIARRHGLIR